MNIQGPGWYLFSVSADKSWNDSLLEFRSLIYTLKQPVNNNSTLIASNWEPYSIDDTTLVLNKNLGYYIFILRCMA